MDQNRFDLIFKRKSKQPHGYGTKIKPTSNLRSKILTPNFTTNPKILKLEDQDHSFSFSIWPASYLYDSYLD